MWDWIIPAVTSIAGGWLSGEGERQGAEAEADAARQSLDLQRQIYGDQRALYGPGYLTGGAATNALAAIYGIAPQDYAAAYNGGAFSGTGAYNPANWGAGQPVQGHSGGGGSNGLTSAIGAGVGNYFGGPIGGAIGGAIGGLIRDDGDNWQTLGTSAPAGYGYDEYFNSQPGFATEWAKPDVQALFNGNRDAYIWWHANGGNIDGKQSWAPNTDWLSRGPQTSAGGTQTNGTGTSSTSTNALSDPMGAFTSSPYGKIAISGFRGVDVPEINSSFATGGKVLSGAKDIALDERGKARLGGAFTDYTNGLRSLAGLSQTAASGVSDAAGRYGAYGGNAITQAGQARGNALASGFNGIAQGIGSAVNGLREYGRENWGWG